MRFVALLCTNEIIYIKAETCYFFLSQVAFYIIINKILSFQKVAYLYFFTIFSFKNVTQCVRYIFTEDIINNILWRSIIPRPIVWEPLLGWTFLDDIVHLFLHPLKKKKPKNNITLQLWKLLEQVLRFYRHGKGDN